jgi:CheY-like chemotaxis protein
MPRIRSRKSARPRKGDRVRPRRRRKAATRATETALAALAHDIRTPLTGILALAELLAASDLPARERGWARAVKAAAEHLAQLTTLVCDAVRAGAVGLELRSEPFDPRLLAQSVGATLEARAHTSGLASKITIADGLPETLIGDAVRIRAALENLIDNAVKFTARGGVELEVSAQPARGGVRLAFSVTDTGIGLSSGEIKKLFRPFSQASEAIARRYGGSGLGLALVRRIARSMGGDLAVTSRPGRGSTFTFSVRAPRGEAAAAAKDRATKAPSPAARGLSILCVEDNPYSRVVLNTILTELRHRTDFVAGGEAAVQAVERGGYDLVCLDLALPGVDGLEVARRIRALPPPAGRVPIIGLSARSDGEAAARTAGMNAFLAKPVSPAALASTIVRTVDRGS